MLPSKSLKVLSQPPAPIIVSFVATSGVASHLANIPRGLSCKEGPTESSSQMDSVRGPRTLCSKSWDEVWCMDACVGVSETRDRGICRIFICSVCFLRTVRQIMPSVWGVLVSSQPFYAISGKTIVQKGAMSQQVTQLCNSKTWIEMVKVSKDGVLSLFIGGPPEIENKGHPPVDQGVDSPPLGCPTSLAHTLPQLQRPYSSWYEEGRLSYLNRPLSKPTELLFTIFLIKYGFFINKFSVSYNTSKIPRSWSFLLSPVLPLFLHCRLLKSCSAINV